MAQRHSDSLRAPSVTETRLTPKNNSARLRYSGRPLATGSPENALEPPKRCGALRKLAISRREKRGKMTSVADSYGQRHDWSGCRTYSTSSSGGVLGKCAGTRRWGANGHGPDPNHAVGSCGGQSPSIRGAAHRTLLRRCGRSARAAACRWPGPRSGSSGRRLPSPAAFRPGRTAVIAPGRRARLACEPGPGGPVPDPHHPVVAGGGHAPVHRRRSRPTTRDRCGRSTPASAHRGQVPDPARTPTNGHGTTPWRRSATRSRKSSRHQASWPMPAVRSSLTEHSSAVSCWSTAPNARLSRVRTTTPGSA